MAEVRQDDRGQLRPHHRDGWADAAPERVWGELTRIPYGDTITYRELAERVDASPGWRAVGRANGSNRLAVIVPCHRVVATGGGLGGYGGGLPAKRFLLDLEARATPPTS